jgi:integrase
MASIHPYRTSKDERRYRVKYRDGGGRQRARSFTARSDAQAFKVDIERRQQAGTLYRVETERFGRTAEAWLERYVAGAAGRVRPRPKSVALVRDGLVTLAPLSDLPIDRIHRPLVEDVVAALARRAPRRAEMSLALLKRILKAAEARGQIVDHAVFAVRVASPDDREPRYLTWEEADEVRSWLPEFVSRIVPIAILTMLRRGEIIALRDRDVDFVFGAITVAGQAQDGERTRTKTRAGQRTVDVGPQTLRFIREQQLARAPNEAGLLFPGRAGVPLDPNHLMGRYFKPAARAAGIPELTFHDLRHTGASLMIAAGCHVKTIAEQMGHADGGALVLQRYGHLYKGARRQAAIATESLIFGGPNNPAVPSVFHGEQLVLDPS